MTVVTPVFDALGPPPFVPVPRKGASAFDGRLAAEWLVSYVATGAPHSVWVSDPDDESRYSIDGPADRSAAKRDAALLVIWRALGRKPFTYVQTTAPGWVIGRAAGTEAGVFLGASGDDPLGSAVPSAAVSAFVAYSGDGLNRKVRDSGVTTIP